jgi:pyruvate dehydrogenase E1 component beta subunit
VERVTGADAPMPYAQNLERLKTPTQEKIVAAVRRVYRKPALSATSIP